MTQVRYEVEMETAETFPWVLLGLRPCREKRSLNQWEVKTVADKAVLKVKPEEERELNTGWWKQKSKAGRIEGRRR